MAGSFRGRAASALLAVALAVSLIAGCARESPDRREVRIAAKRYLSALAQKDVSEIAKCATCVVGMSTVRGGQVLRVEDPRTVTLAALDSLVLAAATAQRNADSLWQSVGDAQADSLYQLRRRLSYLQTVYRNAVRAVNVSHPDTLFANQTTLETRVVWARVRYGGPVVGPKAVDREEMMRMLRAPGGRWIVFSMFLKEDDPLPDDV